MCDVYTPRQGEARNLTPLAYSRNKWSSRSRRERGILVGFSKVAPTEIYLSDELQVSVNFDLARSRLSRDSYFRQLQIYRFGKWRRPVDPLGVLPSDLSTAGSFHKRLIRHNASPSRGIRRASPMVTKFSPAAATTRSSLAGRRLGRIQPNNVTRNYNAVGAK